MWNMFVVAKTILHRECEGTLLSRPPVYTEYGRVHTVMTAVEMKGSERKVQDAEHQSSDIRLQSV